MFRPIIINDIKVILKFKIMSEKYHCRPQMWHLPFRIREDEEGKLARNAFIKWWKGRDCSSFQKITTIVNKYLLYILIFYPYKEISLEIIYLIHWLYMDNTIKIFSNYKLNGIKKFLNPCKFVKIVCYQHKFLNG